MRTERRYPRCIVLFFTVVAIAAVGCGDDDPVNPPGGGGPTGITSYDQTYDWACAFSEDCQDVFDIALTAGAMVNFSAIDITGNSVCQIALYGPGTALGGENLFTGTTDELRCNYVSGCGNNTGGQAVSNFEVPATGTYRLAVTRDWGNSCGGAGTYRLMITSDTKFSGVTQTVDDVQSLATTWTCPMTNYDEVGSWSCATSTTCQDVYDIHFEQGTTVSFSATQITGNSVCQIALYGPGVALGGTNLFTGNTTELRCNYVSGCSNNTGGQTVTNFSITTTGVYRLAVTRDWGTSCGGSGNYRLQIHADTPFTGLVATVNDAATLASGVSCP